MHYRNIFPACTFLLIAASALADSFPSDLEAKRFSGPELAPCPACLCISVQGEVFAGVDLNGSLGKGPGKGRIVKLVDKDHDGVADDALREFALREATDRLSRLKDAKLPLEPPLM